MTKPITIALPDEIAAAAAKAANENGESLESYFGRLVMLDRERRARTEAQRGAALDEMARIGQDIESA